MVIRAEGCSVDAAATGCTITVSLPDPPISLACVGGSCVAALTEQRLVCFWKASTREWYSLQAHPAASQLSVFTGITRLLAAVKAPDDLVSGVLLIDPVAPSIETFTLPSPVAAAVPNAAGSVVVALRNGALGLWTPERPSVFEPFSDRVRVKALWTDSRKGVAGGVECVGYVDGQTHLSIASLTAKGGLLATHPADAATVTAIEQIRGIFSGCLVQTSDPFVTNGCFKLPLSARELDPAVPALCCDVGTASLPEACPICFDDIEIGDGSALALDCGHASHAECLAACTDRAESYLSVGHRINFTMARCVSGCGKLVRHPSFEASSRIAERYRAILEDVSARCEIDYPGQAADEVMDGYLYYVCHRCKLPFWGGNKDCAAMMAGEPDVDPASLVCRECIVQSVTLPWCTRNGLCDPRTPGFDPALFLCIFCCNPATHLSLGRLRLCDACVSSKRSRPLWEESQDATVACVGADSCPFFGRHSLTSADRILPIGCWSCMSQPVLDVAFEPRRVTQPVADQP